MCVLARHVPVVSRHWIRARGGKERAGSNTPVAADRCTTGDIRRPHPVLFQRHAVTGSRVTEPCPGHSRQKRPKGLSGNNCTILAADASRLDTQNDALISGRALQLKRSRANGPGPGGPERRFDIKSVRGARVSSQHRAVFSRAIGSHVAKTDVQSGARHLNSSARRDYRGEIAPSTSCATTR